MQLLIWVLWADARLKHRKCKLHVVFLKLDSVTVTSIHPSIKGSRLNTDRSMSTHGNIFQPYNTIKVLVAAPSPSLKEHSTDVFSSRHGSPKHQLTSDHIGLALQNNLAGWPDQPLSAAAELGVCRLPKDFMPWPIILVGLEGRAVKASCYSSRGVRVGTHFRLGPKATPNLSVCEWVSAHLCWGIKGNRMQQSPHSSLVCWWLQKLV